MANIPIYTAKYTSKTGIGQDNVDCSGKKNQWVKNEETISSNLFNLTYSTNAPQYIGLIEKITYTMPYNTATGWNNGKTVWELYAILTFANGSTVISDKKIYTFNESNMTPSFTFTFLKEGNYNPDTGKSDFSNKFPSGSNAKFKQIDIYLRWTASAHPSSTVLCLNKNSQTNTLTYTYSESGIINYHNGSSWNPCLIFYYKDNTWQPVSVNYFTNNSWKIIGG
jgi:hypothetical protein